MTVIESQDELRERAAARAPRASRSCTGRGSTTSSSPAASAAPRPSACPRSATAGSTPASCRSRPWAGTTTSSSRPATPPAPASGVTIADLPDHAYWERWFPADWVSEMREQIRLWFYSMLFMGVVLDGRAPYRRVLTYEKVNDETGQPMHKSWGNAIWFDDAIEEMGADVMRWMYAGQPPAQNLNFGYGPADEVKRRLLTLWNTYSFFVLYANIEGFTPTLRAARDGPDPATARPLDRWLAARTQWLVGECRAALDAGTRRGSCARSRRSWTTSPTGTCACRGRASGARTTPHDKRAAFETLWYALVQALRCVSPVMPFLTDEMWQNLVRGVCPDAPEGRAPGRLPRGAPELADAGLLAAMESVRAVVELGRRGRDDARIRAAPAAARGDRRHRRPRPARPRRPARRADRRRARGEAGAPDDLGRGVRPGRGDAAAEAARAQVRPRARA